MGRRIGGCTMADVHDQLMTVCRCVAEQDAEKPIPPPDPMMVECAQKAACEGRGCTIDAILAEDRLQESRIVTTPPPLEPTPIDPEPFTAEKPSEPLTAEKLAEWGMGLAGFHIEQRIHLRSFAETKLSLADLREHIDYLLDAVKAARAKGGDA